MQTNEITATQKLLNIGMALSVFLSLFGVMFFILVDNNEDLVRVASVQVLVLVMAVLWLARKLWKGDPGFAKTPLNLPIIAFFCAGLISLVKAVNPYQGLSELLTLSAYFVLFFLIVNNFNNESSVNNFLTTILILTVIVSAHSICQYLHLDFLWFMFPPDASSARVSSVFGNADFLGGYLAMVFPIAFLLFLFRKRKTFYGIASALIFTSLILTFTRSAWVSWGLSLCFMLAILAVFRPDVIKRNAGLLAGSIVCFVVFAVILNYARGGAIFSRLAAIFNWKEYSVQVRFNLWRTALGVFKKSPLIGIGFDNFKIVAQGCRIHNEYLQILAETGILGLGIFIWVIFAYFRQGFKSLKVLTPYRQVLVIAFMSSAVAFLADSLFCFPLHRVSHNVLFWGLAGMTVALSRIESESPASSAGRRSGDNVSEPEANSNNPGSRIQDPGSKPHAGVWGKVLAIAVVAGAAFAVFIVARNFIGVYFYQKGFEMNQYADRSPEVRQKTIQAFERAAKLAPFHYQIQHDWAVVAIESGDLKKGIKAMKWSEKLYPGKLPDLRLHLGLLYYETGRFDDAEKTWKETIDKFPDCAQAYFYLGGFFINRNQLDEGVKMCRRASELDPGNLEYYRVLAKVYYRTGELKAAKETVSRGLAAAPNDVELQKMDKALR